MGMVGRTIASGPVAAGHAVMLPDTTDFNVGFHRAPSPDVREAS